MSATGARWMKWAAVVVLVVAAMAPLHAQADSPVTVSLVPDSAQVNAGADFDVEVRIDSSMQVRGLTFSLSFDASRVEMVSVDEGSYFSDWAAGHGAFTSIYPAPVINNAAGTVGLTGIILVDGGTAGPSGAGVVWVCHMRAKSTASGVAAISLGPVEAADRLARVVYDVATTNTSVAVRSLGVYVPLVVSRLNARSA